MNIDNVNKIIKEINFGMYLRKEKDKEDIVSKTKPTLSVLLNRPDDVDQHIKHTLKVFKMLMEKIDCKPEADIFRQFVKVEPALFIKESYRDHVVHVFHVFVFGLRIISQILEQLGDAARNIFKVRDEKKEYSVFPRNLYNFKQRIFYMWTLASFFHDIGLLQQSLPKIEEGLNKFVDRVDFKITILESWKYDDDISRLDYYLSLISGLYGGKINFDNNEINYLVKNDPYFHKVLYHGLKARDHGIISGLFLLIAIEKKYFESRDIKHPLHKPEEFNKYIKYYFMNDVVRAALMVCLHNLNNKEKVKEKNYRLLPKIHFDEFPLSFLLVIADEFQEFLRGRGFIEKTIIFKQIPTPRIKIDKGTIKCVVKYILNKSEIEKISDNQAALPQAMKKFWKSHGEKLKNRLSGGDRFKLELIFFKGKEEVFSWSL